MSASGSARDSGPTGHPRDPGFVGLLSPFLDTSERVRRTCFYGADLSELRAGSFEGTDCRYQFFCSLPQYETERILEGRLASVGGSVERGVTVTKLEPDRNGVLAELVHEDGSVRHSIQISSSVRAGRTA